MANPDNAVGTNGAFGGRTSVNAFNDVANFFTAGRVSGWECSPNTGLTVALGGDGVSRDVALAQDALGNKTTINNISQAPILVNLNAAPAINSRIDAIVAYIEDSPSGSGITDNPDVVNLLVVSGTVASSPVAPTESEIRTAITADGASGTTAYYVVLASVRIGAGTTDIDATMISQGSWATLSADHMGFDTFPNTVRVKNPSNLDGYKTVPPSTRTQVMEFSVSGLNPSWEYLVLVNIGVAFVHAGQVGMLGMSTPSGMEIVPTDRIRFNTSQTSPSWSNLFTPPASELNIRVSAVSDGTGSNNLYLEDIRLTFIPQKRIS